MLTRLLPACTAATLGLLSTLTPAANAASNLPASGKIVSLTNGDLMCYVEVIDRRGKKHNLGATFELCDEKKYLNKKVILTYRRVSVNDCQSAEPCGKTRRQLLITRMKVIK